MEFLIENWSSLALTLITALSSYTALTETTKDDKIVNVLSRVLNAIIFGKSRGKKVK
tara:strand:+ start:251 stop:421 length:171 start_codon:yes stop_codon:yes gene_type:complete